MVPQLHPFWFPGARFALVAAMFLKNLNKQRRRDAGFTVHTAPQRIRHKPTLDSLGAWAESNAPCGNSFIIWSAFALRLLQCVCTVLPERTAHHSFPGVQYTPIFQRAAPFARPVRTPYTRPVRCLISVAYNALQHNPFWPGYPAAGGWGRVFPVCSLLGRKEGKPSQVGACWVSRICTSRLT